MWRRIREILIKEFRQTLREPRMRALLFGPPLIQLLIFGYAVNLDVDNSRIAWMDMDRTPGSRDLRAALEGSGRFRVTAEPGSDAELEELLDHGRVQLAIRVLPGFNRHLQRGETASVQILVDGTNSNTASIVSGQAAGLISAYGGQLMKA
ncbi:MAG: ABC transporter permease, partial [Acidobacteriales bacterium]